MRKGEKRLQELESKIGGGPLVVVIDPTISIEAAAALSEKGKDERYGPVAKGKFRVVIAGDDAGLL